MEIGVNVSRMRWDIQRTHSPQYENYWKEKSHKPIPVHRFSDYEQVWFEVGAGTGWFIIALAEMFPKQLCIAIERSRMRGKRLEMRAVRSGLSNLAAFRGNAIPALIHGIPSESVDRIYLLYPCPWPKMAQRRNRWYLHPIMPHLIRILKKGGLLIWASDQKFYIDECQFVCDKIYGMEPLVWGQLAVNEYNNLREFPSGRTKFEQSFLSAGAPCYELIVRKS